MTGPSQARTDHEPPEDDPRRLAAALGYLFTPVVPMVNLRTDDNADPFVQCHARQALLWTIPFFILLAVTVFALVALMRRDFLFICLLPLAFVIPFAPGAIWARRVYLGDDVTIPLLGSMVRSNRGGGAGRSG